MCAGYAYGTRGSWGRKIEEDDAQPRINPLFKRRNMK